MKRITTLAALVIMLAFCLSASAQNKISLNGTWNLEFWEQEDVPVSNPSEVAKLNTTKLSATVPGNVELDLLAAGMIDDPSVGNNIYKLRPYEFCQWMYSKS